MSTKGDLQLTAGFEPRDKSPKREFVCIGCALSRYQDAPHETVPYKETVWVA